VNRRERDNLKRIGALVRMIMGGGTQNEREQAREKLEQLLQKLSKTLGDIPALMAELAKVESEEAADKAAQRAASADDPRTAQPTAAARDIPCLELVDFFLREYLELQEHEYTAMALWVLHTHMFERFMCTPRLTFVSPAPDCGKTTAMSLLEKLTFRPDKSDSATPASLYHLLEQGPRTLLLDEMDNAELARNPELRRVLNSGHRRGGSIRRYIGGRSKKFSTFTPVALAAIGTNRPLPSPIISRSVVIKMQRSKRPLRRFDLSDTSDLDAVFQQIWLWVRSNPALEPEPTMPPKMRNRARDNWAPLIALANWFGSAWGERARAAAVAFKTGRDEDTGILLLEDIKEIFNTRGVDRIKSQDLVDALREMEGAGWDEFGGHGLTQGTLAKLLDNFGIKPKSIWPLQRAKGSKSAKGYLRDGFEDAWERYCADDDAPARKPGIIQRLRGV
jgi:hypothetical protein